MINGNLQDFVGTVSAKGQIRVGDVRRLQRDILPNGIMTSEEAELLIRLNAKLGRADRVWAQWPVAAQWRHLLPTERDAAVRSSRPPANGSCGLVQPRARGSASGSRRKSGARWDR